MGGKTRRDSERTGRITWTVVQARNGDVAVAAHLRLIPSEVRNLDAAGGITTVLERALLDAIATAPPKGTSC